MERKDWSGFWQSVTGSLEEGETPTDAAIRELFEETGLRSSDGVLSDCDQINEYEIFTEFRHKYEPGQTRNREYVFTFRLKECTEVKLTEHVDYCWLTKEQAIAKAFTQTDKNAIARWVKEII